MKLNRPRQNYFGYGGPIFAVAAFTLSELLVVVAVLTLLAATQLPALTGGKAPVNFTQCLNNLRQIGEATMVYKDDNNDGYPCGNRCSGPGTGPGSVLDPTCWPMQLLHYLGGYESNVEPMVYVCPSEQGVAGGWAFQVHYVANRNLLRDINDSYEPVHGSQVRKANSYWMLIDKAPPDFCNVRSGGLGLVLTSWNYPPGLPGYRRHTGGVNGVAADGHVEWLRTPLYQPGQLPPRNFLEIGDCASGSNPASSWQDLTTPGNHNGYRVKLYMRYSQTASSQPPF